MKFRAQLSWAWKKFNNLADWFSRIKSQIIPTSAEWFDLV